MKVTLQDIQEKIFMINDKIKMMKMLMAHTESQLLELDELILDINEQELDKKFKKII